MRFDVQFRTFATFDFVTFLVEIVTHVDNGKALEEAQSRNHKFLEDSKKQRGQAAILQAEIEVQAMKGKVAYAEALLKKDKHQTLLKKKGK